MMETRNYIVLRNKETGQFSKSFAHWNRLTQRHEYIPHNDQWEVVDQNSEWDDFVQKHQHDLIPVLERLRDK